MEDALVQADEIVNQRSEEVLILVLMEDALVQPQSDDVRRIVFGLNPCFNGRCTRTCSPCKHWHSQCQS